MRKTLLALLVVPLAASCSSDGQDKPDPTALSDGLAQNISISEIAIMQVLKVPVMQNGQAADRGTIPLIAKRDGLLRVYVTPGDGFSPHLVTARIKLVTTTPTGSFARVLSASKTVIGPSDDEDLDSTINIPVPGDMLEPGESYTVVLNEAGGPAPTSSPSDARYPQDGSTEDLDVRPGADVVRVEVVPVQYDADGSGRLPDTSDEQLERYRQRIYQLYPAATVEITVRDQPFPWNQPIGGSGAGFGPILQAIQNLRGQDQPDPDVYYYAAFEPTSNLGTFCGGGCVTGLSFVGTPNSVGLGYGGPGEGESSAGTMAHEVGHAHGLNHTPCGGAAGTDPQWPQDAAHQQALIGVWGYDSINEVLIRPDGAHDLMSYCSPPWTSDFSYGRLYNRVKTDNQYYYADRIQRGVTNLTSVYHAVQVEAGGDASLGPARTREPWLLQGEPHPVDYVSVDGATLATRTGYFFPYDHLPGGTLWVPDAPLAKARSVRARDVMGKTLTATVAAAHP